MKLNNEQVINRDRARVWAALNDMSLLQQCIPGCESIEPSGNGQYECVLVAAIGPVKARFRGSIQFSEVQALASYVLRFEGSGGVAGFARGNARVDLTEIDAEKTLLRYSVTSEIGGKLAQIGSRLIDATAARMSEDFFRNFNQQLEGVGSERPVPAPGQADTTTSPKQAFGSRHATADRMVVEVALKGGGWVGLAALAGGLIGFFIGAR